MISRSDAGSAAFWKVGALASGRTGWDMPTGPTVPSPDVGWPSKSRRLQKKKKKKCKVFIVLALHRFKNGALLLSQHGNQ